LFKNNPNDKYGHREADFSVEKSPFQCTHSLLEFQK
jgi:hypothetical protein